MSRPVLIRSLLLASLVAPLGACLQAPAPPDIAAAVPEGGASIEWYRGSVGAAFAAASAQQEPVFMYWGTEWCPDCAQLESDVFGDARFQQRARQFVALYVDGDDIEASELGAHFRVRGYPTTIVFSPAGAELGRVPAGYLNADAYLESLDAFLQAGRPAEALLEDALDGATLGAEEWLALSRTYEQLVPLASDTVAELAERCPPEHAAAARRFRLLALMATPEASLDLWPKYGDDLRTVLADPALAREQQLLLFDPQGRIAGLPAAAHDGIRRLWEAALFALAADAQLSARPRMLALNDAIALARHHSPDLSPALVERARALVASVDREARSPLERQSVIGIASTVLVELGDREDAEALLAAEVATSRAPYHVMKRLADLSAERGDVVRELDWARRSYDDALASDKPRIRIRIASEYLDRLVNKGPARRDEIVEVAARLLEQAAQSAGFFTPPRVEWMQRQLANVVRWALDRDPSALAELRPHLAAFCESLDADLRPDCAVMLEAQG